MTSDTGAKGAETMTAPFGEPAYDPASDIATKIMALPWASRGLTDPRSGVFDHDALGDRHGAIQTIADKVIRSLATPAPRTDGGMTAGDEIADRVRRAARRVDTEGCLVSSVVLREAADEIDRLRAMSVGVPATPAQPGDRWVIYAVSRGWC